MARTGAVLEQESLPLSAVLLALLLSLSSHRLFSSSIATPANVRRAKGAEKLTADRRSLGSKRIREIAARPEPAAPLLHNRWRAQQQQHAVAEAEPEADAPPEAAAAGFRMLPPPTWLASPGVATQELASQLAGPRRMARAGPLPVEQEERLQAYRALREQLLQNMAVSNHPLARTVHTFIDHCSGSWRP